MYPDKLNEYSYILCSKSPRRQFLLKELGIDFRIEVNNDVEEVYPDTLSKMEIPKFLAELKAGSFKGKLKDKEILLTADTIVWLDNKVVGKPKDKEDAIAILNSLSGKKHEVITGVCLMNVHKKRSFTSVSEVYFTPLSEGEIEYYVDHHKPYDKAGAYGVQEWIGYVGVEKIIGSYYNVMGLPLQKLYAELIQFIK